MCRSTVVDVKPRRSRTALDDESQALSAITGDPRPQHFIEKQPCLLQRAWPNRRSWRLGAVLFV